MLLPVISVIFEQEGHSAALNGLHATGLYIGVLIASPFMEAPLRRLGFKPLIVIGGVMVCASLFAFVLFSRLSFGSFAALDRNRGSYAALFNANLGDHIIV